MLGLAAPEPEEVGQGPRGAEGRGERQPSGQRPVILGYLGSPGLRTWNLCLWVSVLPSAHQKGDEGGRAAQGLAAQRTAGRYEMCVAQPRP